MHTATTPEPSRDLEWRDFCLRGYAEQDITRQQVNEVCCENSDKLVNVSAYMVETPFFVVTGDRITRVLDLFRFMNLKLLPVVDHNF